jgi:hypothetical protein
MLVKISASLGLMICLVLALHMCLGRRQQLRMEAWWRHSVAWLSSRTMSPFDARQRRRAAHQAAMDAISRAKRAAPDAEKGQWDGNVYRPKQFDKPRKPH